MTAKKRALANLIAERIDESEPLIQVVVGPRQVGKTTALRQALGERGHYHSADSPAQLGADVVETWWRAAMLSEDHLLAIDEVQKISDWSEAVKMLWDKTPRGKLKLILTGSSALLMERGLRETLAGRFELIRAEHWNLSEAEEIFGQSSTQFIEFGCYPGSMPLLSDVGRWSEFIRDAIVEPALGRDLLQLRPVDNPALLRQLFGVAVSLPAQVISLQKLQGALAGKGSIPTISNYLSLLSTAFLITGIQKFSGSALQSRRSSPKLLVHDNALIRAFERPASAPLSPNRFGRYLENAVGARFVEAGWDTYYWKHRNLEVDFVVVGPNNEKLAIEVKTTLGEREYLPGIKEFCRRYPEFTGCVSAFDGSKTTGYESIPIRSLLMLTRGRTLL